MWAKRGEGGIRVSRDRRDWVEDSVGGVEVRVEIVEVRVCQASLLE